MLLTVKLLVLIMNSLKRLVLNLECMEIVVERPTLEFESMAQMLLARKSLALVKKTLEREYIHTYVYTSCRIESLLVPMISLKALVLTMKGLKLALTQLS